MALVPELCRICNVSIPLRKFPRCPAVTSYHVHYPGFHSTKEVSKGESCRELPCFSRSFHSTKEVSKVDSIVRETERKVGFHSTKEVSKGILADSLSTRRRSFHSTKEVSKAYRGPASPTCSVVSIPLRKFPRFSRRHWKTPLKVGFHSTKEVSKGGDDLLRFLSRHYVSIPLRKFPRLSSIRSYFRIYLVSIPLRKFPRQDCERRFPRGWRVSIPLRKFPR